MVAAWLANKVRFHLQLPSAASDPSRAPAYWPTEASMVNFQGSPTAIVTHENRTRKLLCWLRQASLPSCMAGMKSVSAPLMFFSIFLQPGVQNFYYAAGCCLARV